MTLRLWHPLDELDLLVGASFPRADEDQLRRCARAWAGAAQELASLASRAGDIGAGVAGVLGGEPGAASARMWHELAGGDDGLAGALARHCDQLAQACDQAAVEVEYTKLQYLIALTLLATTIAGLLAAAWAGGVSVTGIPAAVAATSITIRMILARLLTAMAVGAMVNCGIDAVAQGIQLAEGHRNGWSWSQTARSAEDGAIFGAAGGGVFLGAARLAPAAMRTVGGLLGAGAVSGAAGGVAAPLAHGDAPTARDVLLSATSGVAGGAVPDLAQPRLAGPHHLAGLEQLRGPDQLVGPEQLAGAEPTRHPVDAGTPDGATDVRGDVAADGPAESVPGDRPGDTDPPPLYLLSDAEATEAVRVSAFPTHAGMAFYPPGDPVRRFAHAIHPTDGYVTLDLHGSPDGFLIDGALLHPSQFAGALRELVAGGVLRLPEGDGIRLLSCDTAAGGDASPAAALSRELGVTVIAPDRPVWTSLDGEEIVASPVLVDGVWQPAVPPDGSWWRFEPPATDSGARTGGRKQANSR